MATPTGAQSGTEREKKQTSVAQILTNIDRTITRRLEMAAHFRPFEASKLRLGLGSLFLFLFGKAEGNMRLYVHRNH